MLNALLILESMVAVGLVCKRSYNLIYMQMENFFVRSDDTGSG